jgi:Arylsulfatase A and related enzymes
MKKFTLIPILGLMFAAVLHVSPGAAARTNRAEVDPPKPNVVIIMSDDQRWDTATTQFMPNLNADLIPNGITYTNSFVPNPLCCPSRASTLTGNYSYTTGVWANQGTFGGFDGFNAHDNADYTIATDFDALPI